MNDVLSQFVGQSDVIAQIKPMLEACRKRGRHPPHAIFYGPCGTGKNYLAERIADFLDAHMVIITGSEIKKDGRNWRWHRLFEQLCYQGYDRKTGKIVVPAGRPGGVVFNMLVLDECEVIGRSEWEAIHSVLQPDANGNRYFQRPIPGYNLCEHSWIPPFMMIAITNFYEVLCDVAPAVLSRCAWKLAFRLYTAEDLAHIVLGYAQARGVKTAEEAALEIGRRSRGDARAAKQWWDECETIYALGPGDVIQAQNVLEVMARNKIQGDGLTQDDLRYLSAIASNPKGGVGKNTLASMVGMSPEMMEVKVENWLLHLGLITVANGGRVLTPAGLERIRLADNPGFGKPTDNLAWVRRCANAEAN